MLHGMVIIIDDISIRTTNRLMTFFSNFHVAVSTQIEARSGVLTL